MMLKNAPQLSTLTAWLAVGLLAGIPAAAQQLPAPGALALDAARDYQQASRYPAHSTVLAKGTADPVRAKRTTQAVTAGRPQDGATLSVLAKEVSFTYPAPVEVYASVAGGKALAITGEVFNEAGVRVGDLMFFDDGNAPDAAAADGLYTGRVSFTVRQAPALAENYLVKVDATFEKGEPRTAVTGFLYSRPHAQLTGRYRDLVRNGSLVIQAQVDVVEAGRFHLAGTLHNLRGEAVGTAQAATRLEPGRHWIDLEFYGLMFHDRNEFGRFKLGSLALSTTTAMPNALNELVEDAFTTRSLSAAALTSAPFGRPDLLEAAARLQQEALDSQNQQ